jgi:hypothetical protein
MKRLTASQKLFHIVVGIGMSASVAATGCSSSTNGDNPEDDAATSPDHDSTGSGDDGASPKDDSSPHDDGPAAESSSPSEDGEVAESSHPDDAPVADASSPVKDAMSPPADAKTADSKPTHDAADACAGWAPCC